VFVYVLIRGGHGIADRDRGLGAPWSLPDPGDLCSLQVTIETFSGRVCSNRHMMLVLGLINQSGWFRERLTTTNNAKLLHEVAGIAGSAT